MAADAKPGAVDYLVTQLAAALEVEQTRLNDEAAIHSNPRHVDRLKGAALAVEAVARALRSVAL